MKHEFRCTVCGEHKIHEDSLTTGYGYDEDNNKVCFDCCSIRDRETMVKTGDMWLYLNNDEVTNWPGTLRFKAKVYSGNHNWAGKQYYAYFIGPEGNHWMGRQVGDNTQLCHCKRLKHKSQWVSGWYYGINAPRVT